jgi:beta-lactamase superfamily II metal-dependent hydrolase
VRISPSETGFVSRSFTRRIPDDPNLPDDPLPNREENELRIHFLPIGAGSCTVVECPGQDAPPMIVDCGSLGAGSRGPGDMDEPTAAAEVKAILAGKPDPNVVISHADKDHIDYMDSILDTVQAAHIWTGGADVDYTAAFNTLITTQIDGGAHPHRELDNDFHNDQFEIDEHLSCGDASVFMLTVNSGDDPNGNSLVVSIDYNEFSAILAGDAEGVTEKQAIANYDGAVKATALAGSHHGADTQGSNGSTRNVPQGEESGWHENVFPEVVVYSHGLRFGHPRCLITRNYHPSLARVPNHPFHCGENNNDNTPAPRQTTYAEYSTEISGKITITTNGMSPLSVHCGGAVGCATRIEF